MPTISLKNSDTKKMDIPTLKEDVLSFCNNGDTKGDHVILDNNNANKNSNDGALKKLDLLKKK